jgi:uncharacterized protein YhaN
MALRIERIDFSPWGCFEAHSLAFSGRVGDVDLIHGRNASGKSTTSRGERSLLYGIDARTEDNHSYDYAELRIGARLQLDGKVVELSRRKRRVGSLIGADGEPLPDDLLSQALGGLTAEVYEALFQVDHETLVQGGAELLQGQGEVGASLFAAAAGIASLHRILGDLDANAERLFNPRGRASVLHKKLAELRDAEKRLREATLRPARHREMTRALAKDEQESDALKQQLRELDLNVRAIERKRAIVPLLDARSERLAELDKLAATPDLAETSAQRRADAQGRVSAGNVARERATKAVAKLEADIAAIAVDLAIIGRADEIRVVKENVSAVTKAASDRRKREGERQEAAAALAIAAAVIGVAPAEIEALRRPATARRALDACLRDGDESASQLKSAQARQRQAERARDDAQTELASAAVAPDVRGLEAEITAALKAGTTVSEQIEQCQLEAKLRRRGAAERLARLRPAPPPEQLGDLLTPSREQAVRAGEEQEALVRGEASLKEEATRLLAAEAELDEERQRLDFEGEAPTAEALKSARETRDEKWATIRVASVSSEPLADAAADDFEHALADVDHLADSRTDHAAQIERTAAAHARAARLAGERAELDRRSVEQREREANAADDWRVAWAATGIELVAPEDAVAWLDEWAAIVDLERTGTEAEERAQVLLARVRTHRVALVAELDALDHKVTAAISLDALIARGQRAVSEAQEATTSRATLQTTLLAAERALATAARELEDAVAARAQWETAWPKRRADAGLPATATPDAAHEIVRAVDEGLAQFAKVAGLEQRIAGMDSDEAEFEASVRALCADLAADLVALEPVRAAAALHAKLVEHERKRERRDTLAAQRATQAAEVSAVENDIAEAQAEIDQLLVAAGVSQIDELPEVEARAVRVRVLRRELGDLEEQVAEVGEGRFTDLAAAATGFDRDRAALELEELREQSEDLRSDRDLIKERIGDRKRELAGVETDITAVQAAQDVELARAAVQEVAVANAKATLAATVVRRAIERYRAQHQDPLLRRANDLFKRFTRESFVELFVDVDERGAGVLIGRQRNRVLKRVPQMSRGTREQLYLALRIAAIERYVGTSGPVPVVFDDVFIESDPPRSERIFEALGELATLTQVIVLTHHEHLIDVGRRALKERLVVQDLPDAAPTLREAAAA